MDSALLNGVTAAIARSARSIRYEQLPDDVVFLARQCALDCCRRTWGFALRLRKSNGLGEKPTLVLT